MPLKKKKVIKRKVIKKKPTKKRPAAIKERVAKKEKGKIIGVVTHYFPKVRAGVIKLKASIKIGDVLRFKGHTTDFTQNVASLQLNHVSINQAKKGQEIGLMVDSRVRGNDKVYSAQ